MSLPFLCLLVGGKGVWGSDEEHTSFVDGLDDGASE